MSKRRFSITKDLTTTYSQDQSSSSLLSAQSYYQKGCYTLAAKSLEHTKSKKQKLHHYRHDPSTNDYYKVLQALPQLAVSADIALCRARAIIATKKQRILATRHITEALDENRNYIEGLQNALNSMYHMYHSQQQSRSKDKDFYALPDDVMDIHVDIACKFLLSGVSAAWLYLQLGRESSACHSVNLGLKLAASCFYFKEDTITMKDCQYFDSSMCISNICNHPKYIFMTTEEALYFVETHCKGIKDRQTCVTKAISTIRHTLHVLSLVPKRNNHAHVLPSLKEEKDSISNFQESDDITSHDRKQIIQNQIVKALICHKKWNQTNNLHESQKLPQGNENQDIKDLQKLRDMFLKRAITMSHSSSSDKSFPYALPLALKTLFEGLSILDSLSLHNMTCQHQLNKKTSLTSMHSLDQCLEDLKAICTSSPSTSLMSSSASHIRASIFAKMSKGNDKERRVKNKQHKEGEDFENKDNDKYMGMAIESLQQALKTICNRYEEELQGSNMQWEEEIKCDSEYRAITSNLATCFAELGEASFAKELLQYLVETSPVSLATTTSPNEEKPSFSQPVAIVIAKDYDTQVKANPCPITLSSKEDKLSLLWRLFNVSSMARDWASCDQSAEQLYAASNSIVSKNHPDAKPRNKIDQMILKLKCLCAKVFGLLQIHRPTLALEIMKHYKDLCSSLSSSNNDGPGMGNHFILSMLLNLYEAEAILETEDSLTTNSVFNMIASITNDLNHESQNFSHSHYFQGNHLGSVLNNNLGLCLLMVGKRQEAKQYFQQAVHGANKARYHPFQNLKNLNNKLHFCFPFATLFPHFNLSLLLWTEGYKQEAATKWIHARGMINDEGNISFLEGESIFTSERLNHLESLLDEITTQRNILYCKSVAIDEHCARIEIQPIIPSWTSSSLPSKTRNNDHDHIGALHKWQVYNFDIVVLKFILEKGRRVLANLYNSLHGGLSQELDEYLSDVLMDDGIRDDWNRK